MEFVTLNNGVKMPQLGYGVYQVSQSECERCVLDALSVGYRSIDTAQAYGNEREVGNAMRKSGVPRSEIFLTTKVWLSNFGEVPARDSVRVSLEKLQTEYLDLVLLHQPFGDIYGAWRALEALCDAGTVRAIGISNFAPDRVVDFANFNRIRPAVNQIEMHPFCQQTEAAKWLKKYNIQLESWGPFGEGKNGLFENPVLCGIGKKYGKSAAQVMLRWALQLGVVVIPKTTHIERMRENFDVFDFALDGNDMRAIAALDKAESVFLSHQKPETVEWFAEYVKKSAKS